MTGSFFGNFQDLASALQVTAQTTPTQVAGLVTNGIVSFIVYALTLFATIMVYYIPANYFAGALVAGVPLINRLVGGGGEGGGAIAYMKSNGANFAVSLLIAIFCSTGAIWSLEGVIVQNIPNVVEACINATNQMKNTPEAIHRFKQLVETTNNRNQLHEDYEVFLAQEQSKEEAIAQYVKTNNPADNDATYMRMKSEYTGLVCKCQIISQKLQNLGYDKDDGQGDNSDLTRHLSGSTTNTSQSPAFNSSFLVPATEEAYGVSGLTQSNSSN